MYNLIYEGKLHTIVSCPTFAYTILIVSFNSSELICSLISSRDICYMEDINNDIHK
jgi:hypothetical protein